VQMRDEVTGWGGWEVWLDGVWRDERAATFAAFAFGLQEVL